MRGQQAFQDVAGIEEGVDHLRAQGQLALADAIEEIFQDMRHLGQIGKAEGAGRALDRMRGTKNGIELLAVRIADVQCQQQRFHAVQMLLRFLEEHLVELAHVNLHAGSRGHGLGGFSR